MKIEVDVRVWKEGGRPEDATIGITREDLETLIEHKALEAIEGVSVEVIDIQFSC